MNGKSIGLVILWWCETIIAVRVLLFSIPVMINKTLAKSFMVSSVKDQFIVVMTATALFYLVAGMASIFGYRYWKAIHYLAAIFTLLLTAGSLRVLGQSSDMVELYYFFPMLISTVFVCFAGLLRGAKRPA